MSDRVCVCKRVWCGAFMRLPMPSTLINKIVYLSYRILCNCSTCALRQAIRSIEIQLIDPINRHLQLIPLALNLKKCARFCGLILWSRMNCMRVNKSECTSSQLASEYEWEKKTRVLWVTKWNPNLGEPRPWFQCFFDWLLACAIKSIER